MLNFLFFDDAKILTYRHITKEKHFARLANHSYDSAIIRYLLCFLRSYTQQALLYFATAFT